MVEIHGFGAVDKKSEDRYRGDTTGSDGGAGTGSRSGDASHDRTGFQPRDRAIARRSLPDSLPYDKWGIHRSDARTAVSRNRNDEVGNNRVFGVATSPSPHADHRRSRRGNAYRAGDAMTFFSITPDSRVTNDRVDSLIRPFTAMYEPLHRRLMDGYRWHPKTISWEINIERDNISFTFAVPYEWSAVAQKQLNVVWPRSTIKLVPDPLKRFDPNAAAVLELKEHYMFSIGTERRRSSLLGSILETVRMMKRGDRAYVQIVMAPSPPDWWEGASAGYDAYKSGMIPRRVRLDGTAFLRYSLRGLAGIVFETIAITQEFFGIKPEKVDFNELDKIVSLRDGPSGRPSLSKLRDEAFETTIRLAVKSDSLRAPVILRSLGVSFKDLDGDNSFVMKVVDPRSIKRDMLLRRSGIKINHDYLSVGELLRLISLPTSSLQDAYNMKSITLRESRIPAIVTKSGILIGEAVYKGVVTPVYKPTSNLDELCLPTCVIGQMGSGKTTFGANLAVEAVRNGFFAVVIDPARGEIGNEVEKVIPANQRVRYKFGKEVISLDWKEVVHGDRSLNRLANEMVSFFEAASEEAGAQTVRYLRSAAKAVPTGRLSDIINLMTNDEFRKRVINTMRPMEKAIWTDYDNLSFARQAQIASPVLNRIDVISGDDYLMECMGSNNSIDFVELLSKNPKAVIIDLPKEDLGAEAVDVIASLIATKLNLAMLLRRDKTVPVFVIQDEPHQYIRSSRTWRSVAVESRKYRFAYVWMFHAWEHLSKDLAAIIQAAGPHYHLYSSSKATYRSLAEEIKPFEVEDAMKTPTYHAINVIRAGGNVVTPFMSKMLPPPSKRTK